MGLDILAFNKAKLAHHSDVSCNLYIDTYHHEVFSYPEFEDRLDGLHQGHYVCGEGGKKFTFVAGSSYLHYENWRELLAFAFYSLHPIVLWQRREDLQRKPFIELICMANDRGAIGVATSEKLAKDFGDYREKAVEEVQLLLNSAELSPISRGIQVAVDMNGWLERYDQWHQAFSLASDDGVVIFH